MYDVIIAEDEAWIRCAIAEMVDKLPQFTVVGEAANGEQAWELIQQKWPTLMITDIMMPKCDGLDLIKRLQEQHIPTISIVLSGHENFQYAQQAMKYGAMEYLLKPVEEEQLLHAILRSVKRQEGFPEIHAALVNIQKFIDKVASRDTMDFVGEQETVLNELIALKRKNPGIGIRLSKLFSGKCQELLHDIDPDYVHEMVETDQEEDIRKHFAKLAKNWLEQIPNHSAGTIVSTMSQACEYIQSHYNKELTLSGMAGLYYISISYFSSWFKKHTGETFINYLNQVRIKEAKRLLANSGMKIYEIADQVGFVSLPYFNRVFKNITGMSPNEFRKSLLQ